ncbi:hypothetical protein LTR36_001816 [Oleoguttula mirabilis]|uniref:PEBP-like protein n=1 Tax=Oleoguttula mirabilis TaxID=1507867 RepID=A0AAV9JMK5_9PEZI|nr:hypothetical protein LTR36_001816 [Oleoguttula mirabilis]
MARRSLIATAALLLAASVFGQTPPGTQPSTNKKLGARYNTTEVTPNILLPEALVATGPTVYLHETLNGTHMVMLVDLAIPQSSIDTTGPQAAGLEDCRTTRLHWYQPNLTQTSNGTFVSNSTPIATYGGPMPGLNDIAHTYTLYLFAQPANFELPAWDAGRTYDPISVYARMNFSVEAIAGVAGSPVAANYFRVMDPSNNATGTASNGTCPSNTTTTTSATPVVIQTGLASKMERSIKLASGVVASAAFAML